MMAIIKHMCTGYVPHVPLVELELLTLTEFTPDFIWVRFTQCRFRCIGLLIINRPFFYLFTFHLYILLSLLLINYMIPSA